MEMKMTIGFKNLSDFFPIIGWELYQVIIDKYHVVFLFENESALLNISDRFSFKSVDDLVNFSYEIYGDSKTLNIDRILRMKINDIKIYSQNRLDLIFENGDVLSVYDNPKFRSWWFLGGREFDPSLQTTQWSFEISDLESDDL
jgi:hypothetical protein